ncbi:MAG: hypothetical protein KKF67_00975 [Nanoarchaeota archaeon]|nr:hypothetical protein [Nanoarchaeota archaeon]
MVKKIKILFICKWNRFRSKFAEAYFNQISKNKEIKAKSVGVLEVNIPMKPIELRRNKWIKKEYGISLSEKSKGINVKDLDEANKIIVVANDVPFSIFKSKRRWEEKLSIWNVKDGDTKDKKNLDKIVNTIKKKVEFLIKDLEKQK